MARLLFLLLILSPFVLHADGYGVDDLDQKFIANTKCMDLPDSEPPTFYGEINKTCNVESSATARVECYRRLTSCLDTSKYKDALKLVAGKGCAGQAGRDGSNCYFDAYTAAQKPAAPQPTAAPSSNQ